MATRALVYDTEILETLLDEFRAATEFNIAVALVTSTGLQLLLQTMRGCLTRRGRGELLFGVDLPSHPEALARLLELQREFPDQFSVKRFKSPASKWLHPKFYIFRRRGGRRRAVVGSSNLTAGGLGNNYEASLWSDDPGAVARLAEYFDELHHGGHARQLTSSWLRTYRQFWEERRDEQDTAERTRERIRAISQDPPGQGTPKRIRGHKFVFTGGIPGWPRERRLYPRVRKLGGLVGLRASALGPSASLVHGNRLGDQGATLKLKAAKKLGLPIIGEEEFLEMLTDADASS
jgi:HKD family nuclease